MSMAGIINSFYYSSVEFTFPKRDCKVKLFFLYRKRKLLTIFFSP